jgi:hypothetical protein
MMKVKWSRETVKEDGGIRKARHSKMEEEG